MSTTLMNDYLVRTSIDERLRQAEAVRRSHHPGLGRRWRVRPSAASR
jgi:hypothetical protein